MIRNLNQVAFQGYGTILSERSYTSFSDTESKYLLDLGQVGEVCWVWADGKPLGDAIIPPYRFPFSGEGKIHLTVVTTSHLGYAKQDGFSAFLTFEPVGLLGPVKIRKNG